MQPIHELLNKIKWDDREDPSLYEIGYLDRVEKKLDYVKFVDIISIDDAHFVVEIDDRYVHIPLHRIKEVKKNSIVMWEREWDKD